MFYVKDSNVHFVPIIRLATVRRNPLPSFWIRGVLSGTGFRITLRLRGAGTYLNWRSLWNDYRTSFETIRQPLLAKLRTHFEHQ